jgi:hypothetical protein
MPTPLYYSLREAEEFKNRFSSWIGKKSHIGQGVTETLASIEIKQKKIVKPTRNSDMLFRIEFVYENNHKLSAHDFLYHNALWSLANNPEEGKNRRESAA